MDDQHRATPHQWLAMEVDSRNFAAASTILELRDRIEALEAAAESNHPAKPDSSLVERVRQSQGCGSHLLTTLTEQIERCKAQGFTDADTAQAAIDATADWFEDSLSRIGMSPVMIPSLLRWQAHQHEHLS